MTEASEQPQKELFEGFENTKPTFRWRKKSVFKPMAAFRVRREDVVLMAIGGLMVLVIGFCFGVERGKRMGLMEPVALVAEKPQPAQKSQVVATKAEARYLIQVASFANQGPADRAQTNLSTKGFRSWTEQKGKYVVLYVGGFTTFDEASQAVGQLRKPYRDCFIRKLT